MTASRDQEPVKADVNHVADVHDDDWEHSRDAARAANDEEHDTTTLQALKANWRAVCWSLLVSMSIIMEGYDTSLIFNFFGYPAYRQQFGEPVNGDDWQVPGAWQSALGSGSTAGCIIGAFLNGFMIKKWGFRWTFLVGLLLMIAFVFLSFFGNTVELQTVGQTLCGLPWGIFATIGPAYASELLPLALRPYLTAYTNMCFAIGQFIAAGVVQSMIHRTDQWSYRIPFAIQWVWPVPLLLAVVFMPESPWWLSRNGRYKDAEATLIKLGMPREKARRNVAMMVHTNETEMELVSGSSYIDCFRGTNRRRTEIACVTFAGQVLVGSQFAYSGTYFFEQAGMSHDDAYKLGLGGTAIAFVGTIISWFMMRYFGRRLLYISGAGVMSICLFIIGVLTIPGRGNNSITWTQSSMCIIWLFTFSMSTGPIGWTIPAEVSSTRLRSKTIVLARNSYYVILLIANVIEPYFMNPGELNWRGYTGFFWLGGALITFTWAFFRLTETKGRTFEELDVMFGSHVPTRQFKKYVVDAYADHLDISQRAQRAEDALANEKV